MAALAPGRPGSASVRVGWRGITALAGLALGLPSAASQPQSLLRLARIEHIPDPQVGAEILQAVYCHVGLAVQNAYASLIAVQPPVKFIEPSAFVKRLDVPVDGWPSTAAYAIGLVRGVDSSVRGTRGMAWVEAATTIDPLMQMLWVGEAPQAMAANGGLQRLRQEITARLIRQAAP